MMKERCYAAGSSPNVSGSTNKGGSPKLPSRSEQRKAAKYVFRVFLRHLSRCGPALAPVALRGGTRSPAP
jgi:hypothetical protein